MGQENHYAPNRANYCAEPLYGDVAQLTKRTYELTEATKDVEPTIEYYKFNTQGDCVEKKTPYTILCRYEYDYDSAGRILAVRFVDENGQVSESERITYDSHGRKIEKIEESCRKTWTYDSEGNMVKCKTYDSDGALCGIITWTYDSEGRVVEEVRYSADKKGVSCLLDRSTYTYNDEGKLLYKSLYNSDNKEVSYFAYRYDSQGRLICRSLKCIEFSLCDTIFTVDYTPEGKTTRFVDEGIGEEVVCKCDKSGRMLERIDREADTSYVREKQVWTYDEHGNEIASLCYRPDEQSGKLKLYSRSESEIVYRDR